MNREDGGAGLFEEHNWKWYSRLRGKPGLYAGYRYAVAAVGFVVVVAGLIMVPFPGPGWLVVFIGVGIWASEFHWAARLHNWGWAKVRRWARWIAAQPWWVRGGVATGTFLFVSAVVWTTAKLSNLAAYVPAGLGDLMRTYLFL